MIMRAPACVHMWEEVRRVYSSVGENRKSVTSHDDDTLRMFMLGGATNIEQKCVVCGFINITTVPGKCTDD